MFRIYADDVIRDLESQCEDDLGDTDLIVSTKTQRADLTERLTAAFRGWLEEHAIQLNFIMFCDTRNEETIWK